ncbi:hypothetical protein [Pseudarthrobacter cellobiosi]|uniref:hypothetical protein n=1 Tax=Pseudarthrobacter cellobiosi TaxID=2953654 RepID=UPI00208DFB40|nr:MULTISPECIES: hypothetical protein [unclassified Pseudarthrobacter]MCO4253808.1 hypothetical protein [Pseudarthrobacter sp. HLT1-5]MCO4272868.1 hypothetical protein [Pseudarthrobacter sp. HLT3-5]
MNIKRTSAAAAAAVFVVLFAGAVPASADIADPHAACTGLGISDHAVADGPGAVPAIINEIKGAAAFFGFDNAGQIVSRFSQVHAGTHVPGCEEAIEDILVAGP